HGAREIAGAEPVDRVGVPDTTDIETAVDPTDQLLARHRIAALEHDVGGSHAGLGVELTPASSAEAEAVSRDEGGRRGPGVHAELGAHPGIAEQALSLVPVGETPGQDTGPDQFGAAGGKALTGDALRAHVGRSRAIVVDAERGHGNRLAELTEKRRARG